jgi:PIN domain nuclease of toxin-antitoxin system
VALLLDTHAFLWWVDDAPRLTERARAAIALRDQACFVSLASCWEIGMKVSLGKLTLESSLERFLAEQMAINGFQPLAITLAHVARVAALPFHHRDPFDRLLVGQALDEDLTIVSADPVFQKYGVRRVW